MCRHEIEVGAEYVVGITGPKGPDGQRDYLDIYGVYVEARRGSIVQFRETEDPLRSLKLPVRQVYNEGRGPLSIIEIYRLRAN